MDTSVFPELLTPQEVAKILRIDESTVRRWAKDGILDAVVVKKGVNCIYRIPRSTLERVIKLPFHQDKDHNQERTYQP